MKRYEFQKKSAPEVSDEATKKSLDVLFSRIGHGSAQASLAVEDLRDVKRFIRNTVVNIEWYDQHLMKRRLLEWSFFLGSCVLVVALPPLVSNLESIIGAAGITTDTTVAQGTTLLAGIFGVHRMVQTWLEKRNMTSIWVKASADLKELLFAFEDRWRDKGFIVYERSGSHEKTSAAKLQPMFREALQTATAEAARIVREEKNKYYAKMGEHIHFNLAQSIADGALDAKKVTEALSMDATDDDNKKLVSLEDYERKLKQLKQQISENPDPQKIEEYKRLRRQRDDVELQMLC